MYTQGLEVIHYHWHHIRVLLDVRVHWHTVLSALLRLLHSLHLRLHKQELVYTIVTAQNLLLMLHLYHPTRLL